MLRLVIGKAGTGKTAAMLQEINAAVQAGQGRRLFVVPEQYSHEAERELCRICGDSLSVYAEVLSFTGFARKMANLLGGAAAPYLDKGGKLICIARALSGISTQLRVYNQAARKAELQAMLLGVIDELKTAGLSSEFLYEAATEFDSTLGDKLTDLALIYEAYEAIVANGHADPSDRITVLASQIAESGLGADDYIYIDGFIDFTNQELAVLRELMKKGVHLTVCLTLDSFDSGDEVYELSRRSGRYLLACAKDLGVESRTECFEQRRSKAEALNFLADNAFSFSSAVFAEDSPAIELCCADNIAEECEFAAATALRMVRDKGLRWRDVAVAVRGFDDYRATLESVFDNYGVPLFQTRRSALLSKPLPSLIAGVYEITGGFWELEDVVSYMRTGLAGLDMLECDRLENYIFKWQLRGAAWLRRGDWRQHPEGYGAQYTEEVEQELQEINALRRRLAEPIIHFEQRSRAALTASEQAHALTELFDEISLPEQLTARAEQLMAAGDESAAQEYLQLWDIIVSALEQCEAILGDAEMDMDSFGRLFVMMLSSYDVGTIPVSLDRVSAGDFDRMRRRSIKCLIILGGTDERLPKRNEEGGIFSEDERRYMLEKGIDLGGVGESELWREFSLIYNCISLPSESLIMSYPLYSTDGSARRPAFLLKRAAALFGKEIEHVDMGDVRMSSASSAFMLAATGSRGSTAAEKAAVRVFMERDAERYNAIRQAAKTDRGKLSEESVENLYGGKLRLSASRIDKLASCRFAYFCRYGLKAKAYEPAGFSPPEIGTFMHYVLENVARAVKTMGGFKAVDNEKLTELTDFYVKEYIHTELNDFDEKSGRFVYIFKRLCKDVQQIVTDMAEELRSSDFEPLSFELDFSKAKFAEPIELGDGEGSLQLSGIADRVDGWIHEDKLYLRVVDYKTGRKKFSLSDVWYGMGLQMLLYLFALEDGGEQFYGREIVPAGVMYVPARNAMLSMKQDPEDGELQRKRGEELRRSGIVLDEAALIEAWENGEDKRFIPIKFRYNKPTEDSLISLERLGKLAGHIKETLSTMARQLRRGDISANPVYYSQQENACSNCEYYSICHFSDGQGNDGYRYTPKLSPVEVWSRIEGGAEIE